MRIIFTKGSSLFSKVITNLTKEPVSHCALHVGNFVIHSDLLGLRTEEYSDFRKRVSIVEYVEIPSNYRRVLKLYLSNRRACYDFGALLFLGISLLLRRYLKIPMPKSNLWQATGMFLCTEWISTYLTAKENPMITPHQLYLKLLEKEK